MTIPHDLVIPFSMLLGYLLGSIPFGLLLTRAAGLGDVRKIGSGNIGATNVLRTGNKGLAAATLLLDALKGTTAVLLAESAIGGPAGLGALSAALAGLGAFIGHTYPVWLRFNGGKGVATFLGVLAGLAWPFALAFAVIWLSVAYLSRYSSLSALTATAATPVGLWLASKADLASLFLVLGVLLFWKHRANIARLIAGTESRIGAKG